MPASILVGHATRYGSTQEVAEKIAATLSDEGIATTCQPLKQVRSLNGFDAIVIGAPLYMFHWHKDAMDFLARYQHEVQARPTAVFALGPFHVDEKEFRDAREQVDKDLLRFPWFKPAVIEIFGGKFDPQALRFPFNLIPALNKMPANDIRDWAAIQQWAMGLTARLQLNS